ncbi:hypothetical protein [Streptomyces avermitilis]|uniref:hypothetical protein n=1 Tax=Streptomyces avermitilis TaxID=33903 RepID=UPI0038221B05
MRSGVRRRTWSGHGSATEPAAARMAAHGARVARLPRTACEADHGYDGKDTEKAGEVRPAGA